MYIYIIHTEPIQKQAQHTLSSLSCMSKMHRKSQTMRKNKTKKPEITALSFDIVLNELRQAAKSVLRFYTDKGRIAWRII